MGWPARVVVVGTTFLVGCATIAGISDEPDSNDASTQGANVGSSGSSGSSGTSGASGTTGRGDGAAPVASDASGSDGAVADTAPVCTKKQDGVSCVSKVECCADGCNELKLCGACKSQFDTCDPGAEAPCCAGLFCSTGTVVPTCQPCIAAGNPPRTQLIGGGDKSCCSKQSAAGKCT